jgi:hypothetical protein
METDMAFINSLCRQVREQAGIVLEAAGAAADLDPSSIHRYEVGEREVPFRYARALYILTRDVRLLRYLVPDLQETAPKPVRRRRPPQPEPLPPLKQILHDELQALRALSDSALDVANMNADGVIDAEDDLKIGNMQGHHERVRAAIDRTEQAIVAWRERSRT